MYPPGRLQFAILIAQRLFKKLYAESLAAEQIVLSNSAGEEPELEKAQSSNLLFFMAPGSLGSSPISQDIVQGSYPKTENSLHYIGMQGEMQQSPALLKLG